jgi:hypothetical protein
VDTKQTGQSPAIEAPPSQPRRGALGKLAALLDSVVAWARELRAVLLRRLLIVGALGAMVMLGLFLSNYSSDRARDYWVAMFPLFGITCLVHELAAGRAHVIPLWRILLRQALHWLGPIIAVQILFLQYARGQMSTDAVALTIILVLAVTSFLAGVHFDQSFYWVSGLLALAAMIGTEIETYLWFVAVIVLVAIAVAAISAILLHNRRADTSASG